MPIHFHKADIKFKVPCSTALKAFITQQLLSTAKVKPQLSYVLCSDEYLLNINRQFLKHDYYTDIITFPLGAANAHPLTPVKTGEPLRKPRAASPPLGLQSPLFGREGRGVRAGQAKPLPLSAEIYISIDRIRDNAEKLDVKFEDELLRVIFHGVLHLLGHKDKTKAQKLAMRKLEEEWIRKYRRSK